MIAACVLLAAASAGAQDASEIAARRELLAQAQQAQQAGDHARAINLAERAGRIQMTTSVRAFIAREQFALGRFTQATGNADLCAREAERDTTLQNRDALLQECRALRTELAGRVGRLTVHTPASAPAGLEITLDGTRLSDAFWDVAYPVNPGTIVVHARDAAGREFQGSATIAAGQSAEVVVALGAPSEGPVARSLPPGATPTSSGSGRLALGPGPFVVAGVGVAALATAAGAFFGVREPALQSLTRACPMPLACDDNATNRADLDRVATFTTATNVLIIAGSVAVGAGAAWLIASVVTGRRGPERAMVTVAPVATGWGLSVGGAL